VSTRFKNFLIWGVILAIVISVFSSKPEQTPGVPQFSYSGFLEKVDKGDVKSVVIQEKLINGETKEGTKFETYIPFDDSSLLTTLVKNNVNVVGKPPAQQSMLARILISWLPMIILIGLWIFFMRQSMGGGKGGPMSFGRSKAKLLGEDQVKTTFKDVAGVEEAKEEVSELVDFLRDPGKFQKLGGRIPTGVLLVGSPGTGKTLLAKAVAGEAKVPFFTISGSDFVEMFVGVGASRVRDMFEQAKKQAPCIIFIDEIDAVGRHRGAGLGGGHDEREQTLNQLLVEMDGFGGNEGVIVMAATNRPDVLDPALLRPGRFDRQVVVPLPDIKGREEIVKVHMAKLPTDKDVRPAVIARGTPGFSGADLANLCNEAALFAARANNSTVDMNDFERAKDKIIMGAERRSMAMSEDEKKLTAYHEAGHAIIGLSVEDHDPVYKVTIIPRGRALGVTMFLPESDRYSYSRKRLFSKIKSMFGGRIAEEMIFGKDGVTTGASNDIEKATELARNMVTKWGLSDRMGPISYGEEEGEVFLGRQMNQHKAFSDETAAAIDEEIRKIVDDCYSDAEKILKDNIDKLHTMSDALMKYETIGEPQLAAIMAGDKIPEPKGWSDEDNAALKSDKKPPVSDTDSKSDDKEDSSSESAEDKNQDTDSNSDSSESSDEADK
jgi:cell division protease FtsH